MNTEQAAGVRAFAALPQGVHPIDREQAAALVREHLKRVGSGGLDGAASELPLLWIDVSNPGAAEAAWMRDQLGLHPLAVEDTVRGRQRPKLDRYPGYLFLVVYSASINPERERMALHEVHLFLGTRFLVTVHDHRMGAVSEVVARWRAAPDRLHDVGSLSHALLDVLVDEYFPVLEHFADRTEQVESAVFAESLRADLQRILQLRHELVLCRRVISPTRDVLSTLLRRDLPLLRPELLPYFQDVYDHTIRVTEEIDALRELLGALLDAQFSSSAHQLNQTLRMMTAWSIILMSMTLVAGIYGMNFVLMPELDWRWGYPLALMLMAALGTGLAWFFRRRRWL